MTRSSPSSVPPLFRGIDAFIWLGFIAAVFALYLPALHGTYLWDDAGHLTRPDLQSLDGLWRIWTDIGATQQYYPLLHSAFWLEHQLWGQAEVGYHVVNVLQHATAAFLFGLVLRRLAVPGAWIAAALFAVHPVCVESVAWIAEQKNTLSLTLYLAAALAYLRFDEARRDAGRAEGTPPPTPASRRRCYAFATVLFVLALLTKTVTASLPAALLVVAWWRRGTVRWREDVLPLAPWFAAGAAMGLLTAHFERTLIGAQGADFSLGWIERLLLAARVPWHYLLSLVAPFNLTFIYPRWEIDASALWPWLFPAATLAALGAGVVYARRGRRAPLAAALLFGGTLFPVLGFFNVYPFIYSFVADHFQYHASLALFALGGTGLALLRAKLPAAGHATLVAALTLGLGALSWNYAGDYRDAETLYRATLARNPACWMAHNNLAILLVESDRATEALPHYEKAVRLRPAYAEGEHNWGFALNRLGRFAEARPHLERALQFKPDYASAHNELGVALMGLGQSDAGRTAFETAVKLDPRHGMSRRNLGLARASAGRTEEALPHFEKAVELLPNDPEAHVQYATALIVLGRHADGVARFERALALDPENALAHFQFAHVLRRLGRMSEANRHYRTALELDPSLAR